MAIAGPHVSSSQLNSTHLEVVVDRPFVGLRRHDGSHSSIPWSLIPRTNTSIQTSLLSPKQARWWSASISKEPLGNSKASPVPQLGRHRGLTRCHCWSSQGRWGDSSEENKNRNGSTNGASNGATNGASNGAGNGAPHGVPNGSPTTNNLPYVNWFREAWPYIQGHRGSTFVIVIPGEVVENRAMIDSILQVLPSKFPGQQHYQVIIRLDLGHLKLLLEFKAHPCTGGLRLGFGS